MRSDHLKRHMKQHPDLMSMNEDEVYHEIQLRRQRLMLGRIAHELDAPRECIEQDIKLHGLTPLQSIDVKKLRDDLLVRQNDYCEKIELGKEVYNIIGEGRVEMEALSKQHCEAMNAYINRKPNRTYEDIVLRTWQQDALKLIGDPSERKVIWITGTRGNEGKSWFQDYVKQLYGYNRVIQIDLRTSHRDICNILRKKPLPTIDIFLFNDARSNIAAIHDVYKVLENIKDGEATGSKFDNNILKFRTPNTIMIFSNKYPQLESLSRDRWTIYNANQDGLNLVTESIRKMKKDGYKLDNSEHLQKYKLYDNY